MQGTTRAFVRSRLGKKIFLIFLAIVAVPLVCTSLLSRELSEYVLKRSTEQLLRDASKSAGLNLMDRLRHAEALLRIRAAEAAGGGAAAEEARARSAAVFAEVMVERLPPAAAEPAVDEPSRVQVDTGADGQPRVRITFQDGPRRIVARGVLSDSYLWENLDSPLYTLCVRGPGFARPLCIGSEPPTAATVEIERPFHVRPYLNGEAWTLRAVAAPDLADYLPIAMGELFGYVAAAALLAALTISAFFIRRATTPLDTLIGATRALRAGDYGHVIPLSGMHDEFRDLAVSFNQMAATIGEDIAYMEILSAIDEAIVARRPIPELIRPGLAHMAQFPAADGVRLTVVDQHAGETTVLRIAQGTVETVVHPQAAVPPSGDGSERIARTASQSAYAFLPAAAGVVAAEFQALKSRVAVALNAEEHERTLVARAARDSLTGLLNRLGLVERLDRLAQRHAEDGTAFAVVYLDLDGFKEVNDAYGHDTGDRLLVLVARRIAASLGGLPPALARLGGDEFVFALAADADGDYRKTILAVLHDLQAVFALDELRIQVGASLGVAVFPQDGADHSELLKSADLAMYAAKARGRNQAVYYDATLDSASAERIELRRELADALAGGQLHLVYQPRVSCADRRTRSAEALLRWNHPVRGPVSPARFIPLAEESGLIVEIGYWVLETAIVQQQAWAAGGGPGVAQVSVNLSPVQLMHDQFLDRIEQIVTAHCIVPGTIELEVTEGALIKDIDEAVRRLERLRAFGFSIALDDFGVGYSAMSYLSLLPFDTLKIDKSFVNDVGVHASASAIAAAIVALGTALQKEVVAEGVETEDQAARLTALGVHELQGFLFSRPLAPDDLEAFLLARA